MCAKASVEGGGRTTSEVATRRILRAQVEKLSYAGRKISVRTKINFRAKENIFFVRTEIYLLPQENLPNLAERSNALFNNKLIYHDQDQSC